MHSYRHFHNKFYSTYAVNAKIENQKKKLQTQHEVVATPAKCHREGKRVTIENTLTFFWWKMNLIVCEIHNKNMQIVAENVRKISTRSTVSTVIVIEDKAEKKSLRKV